MGRRAARAVTDDATDLALPPVPVQQIVDIQRRWEAWIAAGSAPPYEELLQQALGDVRMLARYATGHVQHAYNAGKAMAIAQEGAYAQLLHATDLLEQARLAYQEALAAYEAQPAEVRVQLAVVPPQPPDWDAVVTRALHHRGLALAEVGRAAAMAALDTAELNDVQVLAANYEQGPVGPPVRRLAPGTSL